MLLLGERRRLDKNRLQGFNNLRYAVLAAPKLLNKLKAKLSHFLRNKPQKSRAVKKPLPDKAACRPTFPAVRFLLPDILHYFCTLPPTPVLYSCLD